MKKIVLLVLLYCASSNAMNNPLKDMEEGVLESPKKQNLGDDWETVVYFADDDESQELRKIDRSYKNWQYYLQNPWQLYVRTLHNFQKIAEKKR
jgi:hypothetical protein